MRKAGTQNDWVKLRQTTVHCQVSRSGIARAEGILIKEGRHWEESFKRTSAKICHWLTTEAGTREKKPCSKLSFSFHLFIWHQMCKVTAGRKPLAVLGMETLIPYTFLWACCIKSYIKIKSHTEICNQELQLTILWNVSTSSIPAAYKMYLSSGLCLVIN